MVVASINKINDVYVTNFYSMLSGRLIFPMQNYRKCQKEKKALKHMTIDLNVCIFNSSHAYTYWVIVGNRTEMFFVMDSMR
jgi:hypothetical protein